MAMPPPGLTIEQHLANNDTKGKWLHDGADRLERAYVDHPGMVYPEKLSLRKRIELVLKGTRAEPITGVIQDRYVPLKSDVDGFLMTMIAAAIMGCGDPSLLPVFKGIVLEDDLGM